MAGCMCNVGFPSTFPAAVKGNESGFGTNKPRVGQRKRTW